MFIPLNSIIMLLRTIYPPLYIIISTTISTTIYNYIHYYIHYYILIHLLIKLSKKLSTFKGIVLLTTIVLYVIINTYNLTI